MQNCISWFIYLFIFSICVHSIKSDDCFWTGCSPTGSSSYCPASTTLAKSSKEGCTNGFENHKCCRGGALNIFSDALGSKYKVSEPAQNPKPSSNGHEVTGQIQNSKNVNSNMPPQNPSELGNQGKLETVKTNKTVQRPREYPPPQAEVHQASTGNVVVTEQDDGFWTKLFNFFG